MKPKLIHCSFDLVDDFTPRIPDSRVIWKGKEYEDCTTPRICVAPSVLDCLKAIPKAGETIRWMEAVGMKPIVHAYYLKSENVHICTKDDVLDADNTHEMWVLDKPKDWHRVDYEITDCFMTDGKDQFGKDGVFIHAVDLKRVRYTDNLKEFLDGLGVTYEDFPDSCKPVLFRKLAMVLDRTDLLMEKRKKHLHHKNFENLQRRVKEYREDNNDT